MRFYNYFLSILLTFLINCNFVKNNKAKEELYGNIYLVKNVVPSQIKRTFLEIMNTAIMNKHKVIDSKRKYNTRQDIKLKGAIVILKNVQNNKHDKTGGEDATKTIHKTYNPNNKKPEKRRSIPRLTKNNHKIVVAIVNSRKKRNVLLRGLNIEDLRERPKTTLDHSKSNILRDKYGDACIKVAVRKCYKALYAVNKNICKARYRCKSSFRSYFKNKSKAGCINEFDYTKRSNKEKKNSAKRGKTFVDATREGYLDACIPYMVPNYKVRRSSNNLRDDASAKVFANVLRRSSSDRECQKLSRAKCVRACSFALKESCAQYDCTSRKKKSFSKACKEQCKTAYEVRRASDSSDSSGSD